MENNKELARIFYLMSDYFIMNDVAFKPQAYRKAAESLEEAEKDVIEFIIQKSKLKSSNQKLKVEKEIQEQDKIKKKDCDEEASMKELAKIPGVGRGIAEKILEYLKTGKIKEYEKMKKETPVDLEGMTAVAGLGPKKIKALYEKLKVKNLADLEKAAKAGKIGKLENFGEKSEQNILQGIEFLKKGQGRMLLGQAWGLAEKVKAKIGKLKGVKNVSEAGSLRRRKETIGDIDILAAIDDAKAASDAAEFFASMPEVEKVIARGETKVSVQTEDGFNMDLRIVPSESWGSALQYFTGSKEHNIATRKIAIEKGYKLNEYGLFEKVKSQKSKGKSSSQNLKIIKDEDGEWDKIAGKTEEEVYEKLGMAWVPPEMREDMGEVEAAMKSESFLNSKTIDLKDIKGDLHCHSHWNDNHGEGVKAMVEKAISLGYEYIGISDHTKTLRIEHGLNEKELLEQNEFIKGLNDSNFETLFSPPSAIFSTENSPLSRQSRSERVTKTTFRNFQLLHGCEANIMSDGSIDIDDEVLAKLDYVIAGVHSQMKMSREEMTARMVKAMRNPNVDIISHPTGRILGRRGEYEVDFEEILRVAKETGTILEINAHPARLDLKDANIRKAKGLGVRMIINTDAHQSDQMDMMKFGVAQARRGWAEKGDIANTWSVEKFLEMLK